MPAAIPTWWRSAARGNSRSPAGLGQEAAPGTRPARAPSERQAEFLGNPCPQNPAGADRDAQPGDCRACRRNLSDSALYARDARKFATLSARLAEVTRGPRRGRGTLAGAGTEARGAGRRLIIVRSTGTGGPDRRFMAAGSGMRGSAMKRIAIAGFAAGAAMMIGGALGAVSNVGPSPKPGCWTAMREVMNPMIGGQAMLPDRNLLENISASPDHSTLVAAMKDSGVARCPESRRPVHRFRAHQCGDAGADAGPRQGPAGAADGLSGGAGKI